MMGEEQDLFYRIEPMSVKLIDNSEGEQQFALFQQLFEFLKFDYYFQVKRIFEKNYHILINY